MLIISVLSVNKHHRSCVSLNHSDLTLYLLGVSSVYQQDQRIKFCLEVEKVVCLNLLSYKDRKQYFELYKITEKKKLKSLMKHLAQDLPCAN